MSSSLSPISSSTCVSSSLLVPVSRPPLFFDTTTIYPPCPLPLCRVPSPLPSIDSRPCKITGPFRAVKTRTGGRIYGWFNDNCVVKMERVDESVDDHLKTRFERNVRAPNDRDRFEVWPGKQNVIILPPFFPFIDSDA